jgi:hypothetical protein
VSPGSLVFLFNGIGYDAVEIFTLALRMFQDGLVELDDGFGCSLAKYFIERGIILG